MSSNATPESPAGDVTRQVLETLRRARVALGEARALMRADAVKGLDEGQLLEVQREAGAVRHETQLVMATAAAEVADRSTPDLGAKGLARKQGDASPADTIARVTGGSRKDGHALINAGRRIADADRLERERQKAREEGTAEPAPEAPVYPVAAAAVAHGELSVEAMNLITQALDGVRGEARPEKLERAERQLVDKARGLTLEQLRPIVRRTRGLLETRDPEARQERLEKERFLMIRDLDDGSVEVQARLDPVSAAPVRVVIDAIVKGEFRKRREGDALAEDKRTRGKLGADALVTLAKHFMGCDEAPLAHATTRINVTIEAETLRSGVGVAEVEGSGFVLPASVLRRMAVEAEWVPVVLGGKSEPLDVGRAQRDFTPAQRSALLVRDGGCAMCGAPPSYCEAHHIEWWSRGGRSDLSNGVLLCVGCHHTVHRGEWDIKATPEEIWIIPPASVDPQRRPRRGGRARFGLSRRERLELEALPAELADDGRDGREPEIEPELTLV